MSTDKDIKKAIALKYKSDYSAPKVVAKGKGVVAAKIIENAKKYNIPLKIDKQLADALDKLELYTEIPVELYQVVAELLATIKYIDLKKGEQLEIQE